MRRNQKVSSYRVHRAVSLTPAGEVFHRAVAIGLERIAAGARTASSVSEDQRVVVAGQGLALGWRYLIDRYLNAGTLVTVVDSFVEPNRSCFARLTRRGRKRRVARRCLDALGTLTNEASRA